MIFPFWKFICRNQRQFSDIHWWHQIATTCFLSLTHSFHWSINCLRRNFVEHRASDDANNCIFYATIKNKFNREGNSQRVSCQQQSFVTLFRVYFTSFIFVFFFLCSSIVSWFCGAAEYTYLYCMCNIFIFYYRGYEKKENNKTKTAKAKLHTFLPMFGKQKWNKTRTTLVGCKSILWITE